MYQYVIQLNMLKTLTILMFTILNFKIDLLFIFYCSFYKYLHILRHFLLEIQSLLSICIHRRHKK